MKMSVKTIAISALLIFAACMPKPAWAQATQPGKSPGAESNSGAPVESVAGTTWAGPDTHGRHYIYEFLKNGTLQYTYENGTWTNATWKQDGDSIYMSINNKYSERLGRITGTHMEGKAWNVKDETWTWEADKMAAQVR